MKFSRIALGAIASLAFASTGAVVVPSALAIDSTPVSAGEATITGTIEFADPVSVSFSLPSAEVLIPPESLIESNVLTISAPITNTTSVDIEVTTVLAGTLPAFLAGTVSQPTTIAAGATVDLPIEITVGVVPPGSVGAVVGVEFTGIGQLGGGGTTFSFYCACYSP
jgi:hypothetical protein